jgi:hypothetical protein
VDQGLVVHAQAVHIPSPLIDVIVHACHARHLHALLASTELTAGGAALEHAPAVARVQEETIWLDALDYHQEHAHHVPPVQTASFSQDALEHLADHVLIVERARRETTLQDALERQVECALYVKRVLLGHI